MSQIIRESECPKGSLYYYFPDGKEEIAVECIQIARNNVSNELRSFLADTTDTAEGLRRMFERFIGEAEKNDCFDFVPFSFWMAAETSAINEKFRGACRNVFSEWQSILTDHMVTQGIAIQDAEEKAMLIISMLEGSSILSVTYRDNRALKAISRHVNAIIHAQPEP